MRGLPRISSKIVRWAPAVVILAFSVTLGANGLQGQLLKSLFHRDKPASDPIPTSPEAAPDGGFRVKQRYDSLTGGTAYDPENLRALVKPFVEKQFPAITGSAPTLGGAQMVNDDSLCETCHQAYTRAHRTDIHHAQGCEVCHGPSSEHLKTRGTVPGTILSFKKMPPANQNEICLKCHNEKMKDQFGANRWRVSAHAHADTACSACHRNHYTVPPGTPATQTEAAPAPKAPPPKPTDAEIRALYQQRGLPDAQTCYKCHGDNPAAPQSAPKINNMLQPGTPHQVGGTHGFKCVTCHNPHGGIHPETRIDLCVHCHQQNPNAMPWHDSHHAKAGMACVDCHNPHASLPKLGAEQASTCYKCHVEKADLDKVAHPHQINGVNGFKCATCHNPHGNITRETRVDNCLTCHKGHPTMAWRSSTHALQRVACTDCHNPHPISAVQEIVNIDHNQVSRPKRMPMSVEEPRVCYRCHPTIAAQFHLPFHHPVPEGKMLCSQCHDSHGSENDRLLREPTVNLTCFKCHSRLQGPFVYDHPPVVENCMICHNPHGTVAKQLLRQPPTFLCLRCHSGHNGSHHVKLQQLPSHQAAFYTDCTQCHHEVHGSDLPSLERKGPRLQR